MAELNTTTALMAKMLLENPHIAVKTTRGMWRERIMEQLESEWDLDKDWVPQEWGLCRNPECKDYLPGPGERVHTGPECCECGSPVYEWTQDDRDRWKKDWWDTKLKWMESELALVDEQEMELDPVGKLKPEIISLHNQIENSLLITQAKLDEMEETKPEKLSASMLKEITKFLKSASATINRFAALTPNQPLRHQGFELPKNVLATPSSLIGNEDEEKETSAAHFKTTRRKKSEPTVKQAAATTLKRPNFDELDMKIKT